MDVLWVRGKGHGPSAEISCLAPVWCRSVRVHGYDGVNDTLTLP